jgi:hypothetical protein
LKEFALLAEIARRMRSIENKMTDQALRRTSQLRA